jgi:hypothetical protein
MLFCFFADFMSGLRNIFAGAFNRVARTQECGGTEDHDQAGNGNGDIFAHDERFLPRLSRADSEDAGGMQTRP